MGVAPGAGVGRVALSAARAAELHRAGEPVILVVREVYGDEAAAVRYVRGLVSTRGGRTSHAALVAANAGIPCVIEESCRIAGTTATIGGRVLADGDWLSIDGATGAVHAGALPLAASTSGASLAALMGWADDARRMRVLANADTPAAIAAAIAAGAEGIGLVRSENMFLDHLPVLHAILLGDTSARLRSNTSRPTRSPRASPLPPAARSRSASSTRRSTSSSRTTAPASPRSRPRSAAPWSTSPTASTPSARSSPRCRCARRAWR